MYQRQSSDLQSLSFLAQRKMLFARLSTFERAFIQAYVVNRFRFSLNTDQEREVCWSELQITLFWHRTLPALDQIIIKAKGSILDREGFHWNESQKVFLELRLKVRWCWRVLWKWMVIPWERDQSKTKRGGLRFLWVFNMAAGMTESRFLLFLLL